ncbi:MAG TPA: MnhB domain-containing protein [Vicinamibacterales bacterium]|nr:MnhB domain-containing protein [Vicinamibacterales bacterium]
MIQPFDSLMLRTLLGPSVASLQLFAVYVLVHGHYSPGGGFPAGILLAASMILPLLVKGRNTAWSTLSLRGAVTLTAVGVLVYAVVGVAPLLLGGTMLDYSWLPLGDNAASRRSLGILLIEVGVTLGVAGSMVSIFYALSGEIGQVGED